MNIAHRLYAYPVLSEQTNDYENRYFHVEMQREMKGLEELSFKFLFSTDSDTISELIRNDYAEYIIHIECSQTAYRRIFRTRGGAVSFEIPLKRVSGRMEFVAFVVLKQNMTNFISQEWNDVFKGLSFSLPKGSILAFQNLNSIIITKDYEEFTDSSSIISVVKIRSEEPIPSEISMDSSRIKIMMYEKDYDSYVSLARNPETRELINSSIVFPALVYVFEELKDDDLYDQLSEKNWLVSLERAYSSRGQSLRDILDSEKTGYEIAQEVMDMPIGKVFSGISRIAILDEGEADE